MQYTVDVKMLKPHPDRDLVHDELAAVRSEMAPDPQSGVDRHKPNTGARLSKKDPLSLLPRRNEAFQLVEPVLDDDQLGALCANVGETLCPLK